MACVIIQYSFNVQHMTSLNWLCRTELLVKADCIKMTFSLLSMCRKGSVVADVENFFSPSADVSEDTVNAAISKAIGEKDGILSGAEVTCMSVPLSVYITTFTNNYIHTLVFKNTALL